MATPCCYDCLTADVSVKVIDQFGFEHWFCAADWEAHQQFHAAITTMLDGTFRALAEQAADREVAGFAPTGLLSLRGRQ